MQNAEFNLPQMSQIFADKINPRLSAQSAGNNILKRK